MTAATSKQLEQLNSVREALFSQDGWGGSNVKQDTSWDLDGPSSGVRSAPNTAAANGGGGANNAPAGAASGGASGGSQQESPSVNKESNMWGAPPSQGNAGAPRNDGTDLWKNTLSGQPPAPKPQPANPWAPQNPTDFKTWGEPEDGDGAQQSGGGGGGGHNAAPGGGNEFWRGGDQQSQQNQYSKRKSIHISHYIHSNPVISNHSGEAKSGIHFTEKD